MTRLHQCVCGDCEYPALGSGVCQHEAKLIIIKQMILDVIDHPHVNELIMMMRKELWKEN